jgi:hypothetical protein
MDVNISEVKKVARTKKELFTFLTLEVGMHLPPEKTVCIRFLK